MTLTIELAPDIERQLSEAAAREGQDPATFALAAVEEKLRQLTNGQENGESTQTRTLDQMLAGLTGAVHSNAGRGGSRFSESTGEDLAQDLLEKQRQGRL